MEHKRNVVAVMDALEKAGLIVSIKKTLLFAQEINFLGHHILARGIEPDASKIERIKAWKSPRSTKEVCIIGLGALCGCFPPQAG